MSPILARTAEIQSYVVSKATIATITTEGVAEAVRSSADSEAVAEALAEAASVGGMGGGGGARFTILIPTDNIK